jgi:predicted alpha/beta hydrolase
MWSMWHAMIPVLTTAVGYLPMQAFGQGEDLPAGVAREWAAWGRRRNYLFDALGPAVRQGYGGLRFPVRALHIGDDLYAPRSGVEALVSFYGGPREVQTVTPAQAGARRIGHFGWVRPRFEEAIWAPIRDWFLERLVPSPLRRAG